jgi:hypothetical protein
LVGGAGWVAGQGVAHRLPDLRLDHPKLGIEPIAASGVDYSNNNAKVAFKQIGTLAPGLKMGIV